MLPRQSFADFEEAVEYGELGTFLRLNESWDESIEETRPTLPTKPIGVPGAASPSQMASPAHRALFNASPRSEPAASASSPAAKESLRKRDKSEFDVGDELSGYGLQGVKVTDEDLLALVEELGLGAEEAGDLVKGLSDSTDRADKGGEATEVRGRDDGGGGDPELPGARSAAEAAPEAAVPVAHEEAKAAEGDNVGKTETEIVDSAGI